MCGIFGSRNFNFFNELYQLNQIRGNFAGGYLYVNENKYCIGKSAGIVTYPYNREYNFYMGHTQSPTGVVRDYRYETTHPFESENWVLAHNGVLSNYKYLIERYIGTGHHTCSVDSSVIIPLIEHYQKLDNSIDNSVIEALNKLKGTFSLFIYNKNTSDIYIARSGSTLYIDNDTASFTSSKYGKMDEFPDNNLYKMTNNKFVHVSKLKNNSAFLIF